MIEPQTHPRSEDWKLFLYDLSRFRQRSGPTPQRAITYAKTDRFKEPSAEAKSPGPRRPLEELERPGFEKR